MTVLSKHTLPDGAAFHSLNIFSSQDLVVVAERIRNLVIYSLGDHVLWIILSKIPHLPSMNDITNESIPQATPSGTSYVSVSERIVSFSLSSDVESHNGIIFSSRGFNSYKHARRHAIILISPGQTTERFLKTGKST